MKQRLYRFDNLKFILILLVVFGHLLEITPGYGNTSDIYRVIYSFHMPVFIFVSGYFAKYSPRKILTTYIWPYILLQTVYLFFAYYYVSPAYEPKTIQYAAPFWILWYLPCMAGMHLLLPIFDTKNKYLRLTALIATSAVSLLCGYENSVNYNFAVSKILVFMPFFLLGFYVRNSEVNYFKVPTAARLSIFGVSAVAAVLSAVFIAKKDFITAQMMFGQYSYSTLHYTPVVRGAILAVSILWLIVFMYCPLLDKKIPIVSFIGQYTFPIFVFHGLIQKTIGKYGVLGMLPGKPLVNSAIIAVLVVAILGNPVFDKVFRYVFTLEPFANLLKKKEK